jgi:DNA-binding CsgD family transcriptional regulator
MDSFLQFIDDTNNADTEESIFSLFESQLKHMGFDRVVYTLATDHPSINQKAGHGIMKNYPEDWMAHYTEKKYEDIDPVIKHAALSNHPFVWDNMHETMPFIQEQHKLLKEAHEAHLYCGVGLGIHSGGNEIVAMGFASSFPGVNLDKKSIATLKALANQFHFAYCELKRENITPAQGLNLNLTRKELEVLKYSSEGKSKGVIGDILGISHCTVDYHFRNIFYKLKVNDRVLAIIVAIKYGLIKP